MPLPSLPRSGPALIALNARRVALSGLMAAGLLSSGCMRGRAPAPGGPGGPGTPGAPGAQVAGADMQRLYRSMGLVAGAGAIPFVSSVSFLRAPSPDSTLVLVALSMPSRALGFAREGERYAANYDVHLEVRSGATIVQALDAKEAVRVPTFRETSRSDESIIEHPAVHAGEVNRARLPNYILFQFGNES